MFFCSSIKQIIRQKLKQCLDIKQQENFFPKLDLISIPLELSSRKLDDKIVYKSPLCLQLSSIEPEKARVHSEADSLRVAQQFINLFSNLKTTENISNQDLQISISGAGWLEFVLGDRFLKMWLQELPQMDFPDCSSPLLISDIPFQLHYTHARCCSLLRSGHRDRLIQLHSLDFQQLHWQWQAPQPIPFNCLSWRLKEEKKLIRQLITIVDEIYDRSKLHWLKLATNFSEVILEFERNCRIWGEIKQHNPLLAQARLGLIALSQYYLRWILAQKLGVFPPVEL